MLALLDQVEPIVADETEAATAKLAAACLAEAVQAGQGVQLVLRDQPDTVVPLSSRAVGIIFELLTAMAEHRPVSIISYAVELTTQQAADYLNVSRPFLVKLVDRGEIPHRVIGRHRRVRFSDLLAFEHASAEKHGRRRPRRLSSLADLVPP